MNPQSAAGLPFFRTRPDPRTILTPEPGGRIGDPPTYRVAVVGNGPLRRSDRARIAAYRNIVRFNDAKNLWPGERTTVHINPYDDRGAPLPQ